MRNSKRFAALVALTGGILFAPEPCFAAAGAQALAQFISDHIIDQALVAFGGIAAAAVFYYAIRMILEAHSEKAYTDATNSFMHAFTGFAVIACAAAIAGAFYINIDPSMLIPSLQSIIDYIVTAAAGVFVLIVTIAGIRMITTMGEEAEFAKWRKVLINNIIGVVIMMLSYFIVHTVVDRDTSLLAMELRGIALFLLEIIGFTCVIALIVAGVFLIVSIEESLRDRAKRAITGTLIALAIVIACYSLILTFITTTP
jgi:hypothetical protein